jgi:hypothetical protein
VARLAIAAASRAQAEQGERAATAVEKVRTDLTAQGHATERRLEEIHVLVNSRLTKLLAMNEELRELLREWAPNDPRVKALEQDSSQ